MFSSRLYLFCVLLAFSTSRVGLAQPSDLEREINETVIRIPVIVNGTQSDSNMVGTMFKPNGEGPFPFAVLNHGRATSAFGRSRPPRWQLVEQARWLVNRGYAVFVPTRRGYGETGGSDVENSHSCNNPSYKDVVKNGGESVMSVIEYAKTQSFVDRSKFLVIGQSVGGLLTVGITGTNPDGLIAAINFAGGAGGRPEQTPGTPCAPERLTELFAEVGKISRIPMLWIYTENDDFFAPVHARAWHQAFTAGGGKAELRILPPFGRSGHLLFYRGLDVWPPIVEEFLKTHGL